MRYIEKSAFAGAGITELSLDEIAFVSGANDLSGKDKIDQANRKLKVEKNPDGLGSGPGSYYNGVHTPGSYTFPKTDRCAAADNMSNGGQVLQGVGLALGVTPAAPAAPFVGGFGTGLAAVGGALHFINGCGK